MSAPDVVLHGFAFGEQLEGEPARSLGYRLLAPAEPQPWSAEVEELARCLHAAPYPDPWPATDLFCSVLLADGQRLIAVARYGLPDHTPTRRRNGLELIGVVGPGDIDAATAQSIYRWLRQQRGQTNDPRSVALRHVLADVLPTARPNSETDPGPDTLLLSGSGGACLVASEPTEPDQRLHYLVRQTDPHCQWLPFISNLFPLPVYARRGPLIVWATPKEALFFKASPLRDEDWHHQRLRWIAGLLALCGVLLLGVLVCLVGAPAKILPSAPPADAAKNQAAGNKQTQPTAEQLAQALHRLLQQRGVFNEDNKDRLLSQYERLAAKDEQLRTTSPEGKTLIGAVSVLSQRNAATIETLVREALAKKGYDPELVDLVCKRVREKLEAANE